MSDFMSVLKGVVDNLGVVVNSFRDNTESLIVDTGSVIEEIKKIRDDEGISDVNSIPVVDNVKNLNYSGNVGDSPKLLSSKADDIKEVKDDSVNVDVNSGKSDSDDLHMNNSVNRSNGALDKELTIEDVSVNNLVGSNINIDGVGREFPIEVSDIYRGSEGAVDAEYDFVFIRQILLGNISKNNYQSSYVEENNETEYYVLGDEHELRKVSLFNDGNDKHFIFIQEIYMLYADDMVI